MRRSCLEAARTGFSQTSMKTASSSHSWQTGRGQQEGWEGGRTGIRGIFVRAYVRTSTLIEKWDRRCASSNVKKKLKTVVCVYMSRPGTSDWVWEEEFSAALLSSAEHEENKHSLCRSCCCCLSWLGSLLTNLLLLLWLVCSGWWIRIKNAKTKTNESLQRKPSWKTWNARLSLVTSIKCLLCAHSQLSWYVQELFVFFLFLEGSNQEAAKCESVSALEAWRREGGRQVQTTVLERSQELQITNVAVTCEHQDLFLLIRECV